MKTFVTFLLCSSLFLVAGDANAKRAHARLIHCRPHKVKVPRTGARGSAHARMVVVERCDELVLSPSLVRELQRRLDDAGYRPGIADGRLTQRTRRAIAEFQRDYHRPGTGSLDRATAEALLGRERLSGFLIAKQ